MDVTRLSQNLRTELRRELANVRNESVHVRMMVQEVVGKLGESFNYLQRQTIAQNQLVAGMVSGMEKQTDPSKSGKRGQITIGEFISKTDAILRGFVEYILDVSRQSMAMMYRIDDVSAKMLQVEESLGKINAIADLTKVLGLNARIVAAREGQANGAFSVVAAEVRRLAIASREVSDRISDVVMETSQQVDTAKDVVREMASKDMSFSMDAKNKVDAMLAKIKENDRAAAKMLQQVSEITMGIQNSIGLAVLSLQFEDMVTQITQSVDNKISAMEKLDQLYDLGFFLDSTLPKHERAAQIRQRLLVHQHLLEAVSHQPVHQENLDEGDIELF